MKTLACEQCSQVGPMNAMFAAFDRALCESCADKEVAAQGKEIPAGSIARLLDPTICSRCAHDNGAADLEAVGGRPMCHECTALLRNRPFPSWLVNAAIGLVLLAALSLLRNQRYIGGYLKVRRARRAAAQGDLGAAAQAMEDASRLIPEVKLDGLASFYRGAALLQQDRATDALPFLTKAKAAAPGVATIERMVVMAEQGAAFDAKDYDRFLDKSQELAKQDPKDAFAEGSVASAYACKYALTGSEEFRTQSLARLERAKALSTADPARFEEYAARIRFRLETREIISKAEYDKRFPHGWTR